jgi:hypothetical protein
MNVKPEGVAVVIDRVHWSRAGAQVFTRQTVTLRVDIGPLLEQPLDDLVVAIG